MKKTVQVFYSVDDRYAPYLAISIASLIDHTNPNRNYEINIVHQKLSKENKDRLKRLKTKNVKIKLVGMKKQLEEIKNNSNNRLNGGDIFTLTIFFRIFLPKMFKLKDKGIYIDCDTVINQDVGDLFDIDLGDNFIGGVQDKSCSKNNTFIKYFEKVVGIPFENYINSGMMLMDFKKLRKAKFDEHFLYLFNKYHFETIAPDQDYINAMLFGKIKYLDYKWNCMPVELGIPLKDPGIIHYNLFLKPWHYKVMYDKYFWKYVEKSEYKKEIEDERNSYRWRFKKAIDKLHLLTMVKRASDLIRKNPDNTFANVLSTGKEKRI